MTIREHYQEFEGMSVEDVRKRVHQSVYGGDKLRHARQWLYDIDNGIALSAKNVDLAIAIATILAAVAAVVAVFVSLFWKP